MAPQSLESRLEKLEARVTILEQLPARVDALALQIVQLREEMHAAFSASQMSLREEIRAGDEAVIRTLREEIRAGDDETRRILGDRIRASTDEIMGQARALCENALSRIALTEEGRHRRRKRR